MEPDIQDPNKYPEEAEMAYQAKVSHGAGSGCPVEMCRQCLKVDLGEYY